MLSGPLRLVSALMAPLAGAAFERSRARAWLVRIVIAASAIEMFWIVLQAARGTRSHFNEASPFEQFMYGVMGIFAVAVVLAPLGLAFAARRLPAGGLRSGLLAATLLNLLLRNYLKNNLCAPRPSHSGKM